VKAFLFKIVFIHVIVFTVCLSVKGQDMPLTVIANSKGAPSELTQGQLRAVLKGEKLRWNDGSKVTIALMKTSTPIGMNTCKKLYNMTSNELNKLFLALVFQGKGEAPTFFNSVSELQTFISQTPGSIGIIESNTTNNERVINVDGKKSI
jgi:ABC-type phosphate transport system substrate-binding protein